MQDLALPLVTCTIASSAWAVREDLRSHRIPNWLTGLTVCTGLLLQSTTGGWAGTMEALLGVLAGLAILMPMYLLSATGAGDVKLLASLGSLLGAQQILWAGVGTLIAGGVLGISYLLIRAVVTAPVEERRVWRYGPQLLWARAWSLRRERFPYALAILSGVLFSLYYTGEWNAALGHVRELHP